MRRLEPVRPCERCNLKIINQPAEAAGIGRDERGELLGANARAAAAKLSDLDGESRQHDYAYRHLASSGNPLLLQSRFVGARLAYWPICFSCSSSDGVSLCQLIPVQQSAICHQGKRCCQAIRRNEWNQRFIYQKFQTFLFDADSQSLSLTIKAARRY